MGIDGAQFVDLHERFFRVFLGFVHEAGLHGVHDGDEIDEHAQLLFGHPMELLDGLIRGLVIFLGQRGNALNGLLQLLQRILYFFHLTQHQMTGNLREIERGTMTGFKRRRVRAVCE